MGKSREPQDRGARILVKVFRRGYRRIGANHPLTADLIVSALRAGGLPVLPRISDAELDEAIEREFGPHPEQMVLGFDPATA